MAMPDVTLAHEVVGGNLRAELRARLRLSRCTPLGLTRDGDRFVVETVTRGGTLLMPEIDVAIPIDELYRGVEPEEPAEQSLPR